MRIYPKTQLILINLLLICSFLDMKRSQKITHFPSRHFFYFKTVNSIFLLQYLRIKSLGLTNFFSNKSLSRFRCLRRKRRRALNSISGRGSPSSQRLCSLRSHCRNAWQAEAGLYRRRGRKSRRWKGSPRCCRPLDQNGW